MRMKKRTLKTEEPYIMEENGEKRRGEEEVREKAGAILRTREQEEGRTRGDK